MHPDFEMANFHNDITLLRTDKSIEFRKTDSAYKVNSVCLPPYDTEKVSFPPETAVVAGWGTTEVPSDSGSERLLKVSVSLVEHDYCKRTYSTVHNMIMSEKTLCYGRNHKDSCKGDSGGPLVKAVGSRTYTIGIVSFGAGCGSYPGVYTDVHEFRQWIADNIN